MRKRDLLKKLMRGESASSSSSSSSSKKNASDAESSDEDVTEDMTSSDEEEMRAAQDRQGFVKKSPNLSGEVGMIGASEQLKPLTEFLRGFVPQRTCMEELERINQHYGTAFWALSYLEEKANSLLKSGNPSNLTENEIVALLAYTDESGENLYTLLNNVLKNRTDVEMDLWLGFLFFLHTAVLKLPVYKGKVYRGVCIEDKEKIKLSRKDSFTKRQKVKLLCLTSTCKSRTVAVMFTNFSGILFKLDVLDGRVLSPYSMVSCENEIILLPDSEFVVKKTRKLIFLTKIELQELRSSSSL